MSTTEQVTRTACPLCVTWQCSHCAWRRYYVRPGDLMRCPHCKTTTGFNVPVVHSNVYLAEEHMYEYQLEHEEDPASGVITDEQIANAFDHNLAPEAVKAGLIRLGIPVEDPEPTNIDRLERWVESIMGDAESSHGEDSLYWAQRMDAAGIVAPKEES